MDAIFITGATGFIGCHLVDVLARTVESPIICGVRGASEQVRRRRLGEVWHNHRLSPETLRRVEIVPCDLEQPNLGIDAADYEALCGRIAHIIHCGASVNVVFNDDSLYKTNVSGTQEIISLARRSGAVLHYFSTKAIYVTKDYAQARGITEHSEIPPIDEILGGYAKSKALSEQAVRDARAGGITANIYRPGLICGSARTGVCNKKDFLWALFRGFARLGVAPLSLESVPTTDQCLFVKPVDHCVEDFIRIFQQPELRNQDFNLRHSFALPWHSLLDGLYRVGAPAKQLDYTSWVSKALPLVLADRENPILPFVLYIRRRRSFFPTEFADTYSYAKTDFLPQVPKDFNVAHYADRCLTHALAQ